MFIPEAMVGGRRDSNNPILPCGNDWATEHAAKNNVKFRGKPIQGVRLRLASQVSSALAAFFLR